MRRGNCSEAGADFSAWLQSAASVSVARPVVCPWPERCLTRIGLHPECIPRPNTLQLVRLSTGPKRNLIRRTSDPQPATVEHVGIQHGRDTWPVWRPRIGGLLPGPPAAPRTHPDGAAGAPRSPRPDSTAERGTPTARPSPSLMTVPSPPSHREAPPLPTPLPGPAGAPHAPAPDAGGAAPAVRPATSSPGPCRPWPGGAGSRAARSRGP